LNFSNVGLKNKTVYLEYHLNGTDIAFDYQIEIGTYVISNDRTQTNLKDDFVFDSKDNR
jgi:hypothetical protein